MIFFSGSSAKALVLFKTSAIFSIDTLSVLLHPKISIKYLYVPQDIFDIKIVKNLSKDIGFSHFEFINHGQLNPSYRNYVMHHLMMIGIHQNRLKRFDFIFESFRTTIGALLGHCISTPMVYLIFKK